MVVVLLNILIAQFSKSYEEETERAQINFILTRTDIILRMEQSALTRPCVQVHMSIIAILFLITSLHPTVCEESEKKAQEKLYENTFVLRCSKTEEFCRLVFLIA